MLSGIGGLTGGAAGLNELGIMSHVTPHEIIAHLANNEPQLKAFAKLSTARQLTELARIEAQMTSNGHVNTGSEPLWKKPEIRRDVSPTKTGLEPTATAYRKGNS
jgi:hypothetical protein